MQAPTLVISQYGHFILLHRHRCTTSTIKSAGTTTDVSTTIDRIATLVSGPHRQPSAVHCQTPAARDYPHRVTILNLLLPMTLPYSSSGLPRREHASIGQMHSLQLYVLDRGVEPLPLCMPHLAPSYGPQAGHTHLRIIEAQL